MTPQTRALEIQGQFVNLLSFSRMQPFPRLLSISMSLKRSCALSLPLCLFILAHCQDPHHDDNKTDIDQFVLADSHTVNVRYSSPHLPSQFNTCHQHPRRPYFQQQATRPTFCAPSGDLLSQTILARSFLRETTVPLFFGGLQHGLTFGRLPTQPSHFSLLVYFCHVPTVVYRYSLLWERIVFCYRVVSVSM